MAQSPFKLFEPYSSSDKNIFFGRDAEIYALYNLLQQTRLVLIYGASGTGKTSLINAGLPKVFKTTDWFRVSVRRNDDLNASFKQELARLTEQTEVTDIAKAITELHEIRWIPIYLAFDQFEEIFTIGSHAERVQFFSELKVLLDAPLPCKIILSMREEYIGHLYEYEPYLPTLFEKRFRVEPMKDANVRTVIEQMCAADNVNLAEGATTANQILKQVKADNPKQAVHLPYLQVYLHYLYERAATTQGKTNFTAQVVEEVGALGNVLKLFIETQLESARLAFTKIGLPDDFAARLLDEFATDEGTKQSRRKTDLAQTLNADTTKVGDALNYFSEAKLLRADENDVQRYEPVHDVVAKQIYVLRSAENKDYKIFIKQLENDYDRWLKENKSEERYLTETDILKIDLYREKLKGVEKFKSDWCNYAQLSKVYQAKLLFEKEEQLENEKKLRQNAEMALIIAENATSKAEKIARGANNTAIYMKIMDEDITLGARMMLYNCKNNVENKFSHDIYEKTITDSQNAFATKILENDLEISTVAISPDGTKFVIGDSEFNLKVFNLQNLKLEGVFKGHQRNISSVSFSPDNKKILSASWDKTAILWDIETSTIERQYFGHEDSLTKVLFLPNGEKFVTSSWDKTIRIWNIGKSNSEKILEGHKTVVTTISISSDGTKLLSSSRDNTIKLWNLQNGKVELNLVDNKFPIFALSFSKDEKNIISLSTNSIFKIWNINDGMTLKSSTLRITNLTELTAFSFTEDTSKILIADSPSNAVLIDTNSGLILKTFVSKNLNRFTAISVSKDSKLAITAIRNESIKIWRMSNDCSETTFIRHNDAVTHGAFSSDCKNFLTGSKDGDIVFWNIEKEKINRIFKIKKNKSLDDQFPSISGITFLRDNKYFYFTNYGNFLTLRGIKNSQELRSISFEKFDLTLVSFSIDNTKLACMDFLNNIIIWDITNEKILKKITNVEEKIITVLSFSPDAQKILSSSFENTIELRDIISGLTEKTFKGHKWGISSISFSLDGKTMISGSSDKTAIIWNIDSEHSKTLIGHTAAINSVAFSPNCKTVATASRDKTIKIWDSQNGTLIKTFVGHTDEVCFVKYSPDGKKILTGSKDNTARIWDIEGGGIEDWICDYSLSELRKFGLLLEPEDLQILSKQGEILTEEELKLINKEVLN